MDNLSFFFFIIIFKKKNWMWHLQLLPFLLLRIRDDFIIKLSLLTIYLKSLT